MPKTGTIKNILNLKNYFFQKLSKKLIGPVFCDQFIFNKIKPIKLHIIKIKLKKRQEYLFILH